MSDMDSDTAMRLAAFAHIRQLIELRDVLTASDLAAGFQFEGARIPLINPQRGIFKPAQMKYLLSIRTVFPKPGGFRMTIRGKCTNRFSRVWTPLDVRSWGAIRAGSELRQDVATEWSGCREIPGGASESRL
jgi:hypothetical protein